MAKDLAGVVVGATADRLRELARRCVDLADMTAVPEVAKELTDIARALGDEADGIERE